MVNTIKVLLWGKELGALHWIAEKNYASFEYFESFLKSKLNVSPIHLPTQNAKNHIFSFPNLNEDTFKGLPGLLSDVLPDDFGNQLINQYLRINNINKEQFTPLDRLLYIGKRGMGALEFEPATNTQQQTDIPIEVDALVALTKKVLEDREELQLNLKETEHLNELIKVGTSAGGQRAKAVIAYNATTNEIRSGQTDVPEGFAHYLFKFDGVDDQSLSDPKGFGRIEYAYYLMALDCGIDMMPSQLFEENGRAHFMTQRFDRLPNNEKLHMQTLCSLAHFDYKKPGAYSYEDAFDIMRQLQLPKESAIQLYKRMLFNVIARNQDDHTKNISFLMHKNGEWKLSPAYDVTYSYNPTGIWTNSHQMAINGKRSNFTLEDLLKVGENIGYQQRKQTITQISTIVSNWQGYAAKAGIPSKQAMLLQKAFRLEFL